MTDKWLLSYEQIEEKLDNDWDGLDAIGLAQFVQEYTLAHCEPLIRADEAKKFEGWKSPEEIRQIRKDAYKLGVDHQNDLNKLDCEAERTKTQQEIIDAINDYTNCKITLERCAEIMNINIYELIGFRSKE